jgi:hypothetical protein
MKYYYLLFLSLFTFNFTSQAQCAAGQKEVIVEINPDNYPQEISWILRENGVQVGNGTFTSDTICVAETSCIQFSIYDSANDGICCGFGNGSYLLYVDGAVVHTGGDYGAGETFSTGCTQGTTCENPITASLGSNTAPAPNTFYVFTATETGMYDITTCGLSPCDTKLWIYASCNNYVYNTDNTGTIFYDDDGAGCGTQAGIDAYLEAGVTYIIRVGLFQTATCANPINFNITFNGPVTGCTDPTSCNYNPLATVSDGNCYYYPNPNCPAGPDLTIVESAIVNSLEIRQEAATACMVDEGCMNGFGDRTVLAFDTHIKNIGDLDYFVGNPTDYPSQFTFQNCHGHAHYEGYADYILHKPTGESIPIGHKNGFCVMDLECEDGGTAQYGCSNMGITKQCGDIYNKYLDCQWIDITDVDTGEYILAVKVNWDHSPDALGHYESNYDNNWAQVCIRITEDVNGLKGYTLLPNCQPYVDCAGTPFGNAVIDCEGNCNGTAVKGDLDANQLVQTQDANLYVTGILNETLTTSLCKDISNDGFISVWDAGLAVNCAVNSGGVNNCVFPNSVVNTTQIVEIGYTSINTAEGYIDVYMKNPDNKVSAYELTVSGITISDAENLISVANYPSTPQFVAGGNKVITMSYVDSLIPKNFQIAPLLRIYYSAITSPDICVESVVHLLNDEYQPTTVNLIEACVSVAGIEERGMPTFNLYPNPSNQNLTVELSVKLDEKVTISITDAMGRTVISKTLNPLETELNFNTEKLADGFYNVVLNTGNVLSAKPFLVKH